MPTKILVDFLSQPSNMRHEYLDRLLSDLSQSTVHVTVQTDATGDSIVKRRTPYQK
jgi:hypothetical protein